MSIELDTRLAKVDGETVALHDQTGEHIHPRGAIGRYVVYRPDDWIHFDAGYAWLFQRDDGRWFLDERPEVPRDISLWHADYAVSVELLGPVPDDWGEGEATR